MSIPVHRLSNGEPVIPVRCAHRGPRPAAVPPRPPVPALHLIQADYGHPIRDLSPAISAAAYVRGYLDRVHGRTR